MEHLDSRGPAAHRAYAVCMPMTRFMWKAAQTHYREVRTSAHGEELRWLVTREEVLDTRDGSTVVRSLIRHPGICVIVPIHDDGRVVMVRQYRYSLDGELWELPAGTLSGREQDGRMIATESPSSCGARELLEETGYEASTLHKLTECYAMPGTSDQVIHVFSARGLVPRRQALDVGEAINEVRSFSLGEIDGMIERDEIHDAKTIVGLCYARLRRILVPN